MSSESVSFTVERMMASSGPAIYRAWTEAFDLWFAERGSVRMNPVEGEPYWFEVVHEGDRHPHYGRFLTLVPGRMIELTWVTGPGGTDGAETTVRVDLADAVAGTSLRLRHSGFTSEASARRHEDSWPSILVHLDEVLAP